MRIRTKDKSAILSESSTQRTMLATARQAISRRKAWPIKAQPSGAAQSQAGNILLSTPKTLLREL